MSLKSWFDGRVAAYIRRILNVPDIIVRAENANPLEGHYVIVDISRNTPHSKGHPVLPEHLLEHPDVPETYATLKEAMDQAVRLNDIHNLNSESIKIFQLVEVDLSRIYKEVKDG